MGTGRTRKHAPGCQVPERCRPDCHRDSRGQGLVRPAQRRGAATSSPWPAMYGASRSVMRGRRFARWPASLRAWPCLRKLRLVPLPRILPRDGGQPACLSPAPRHGATWPRSVASLSRPWPVPFKLGSCGGHPGHCLGHAPGCRCPDHRMGNARAVLQGLLPRWHQERVLDRTPGRFRPAGGHGERSGCAQSGCAGGLAERHRLCVRWGGFGPPTTEALHALLQPHTILIAATDLGSAGDALAARLHRLAEQCGNGFERLRPDRKDWNEQLVSASRA